ncbi:hypothetical protein D3C80_1212100 [compost metagenome]
MKRLVRHTAFLCFTDDVDKRSSGGLGCGAPATHGNVALLVAVLASRRASARLSGAFAELAIAASRGLHPSDPSRPETDHGWRGGNSGSGSFFIGGSGKELARGGPAVGLWGRIHSRWAAQLPHFGSDGRPAACLANELAMSLLAVAKKSRPELGAS